MPASSIAQILIRLVAIHYLAAGVVAALGVLSLPGVMMDTWMLIGPCTYLGLGLGAWMAAPMLSRLVAAGNDPQLSLAGVTERQLYTTALLVLGLYFALDSFGRVFGWIQFFATKEPLDYGFEQQETPSFSKVTEDVATLVAGIALMLTSHRWAAKLARSAARV